MKNTRYRVSTVRLPVRNWIIGQRAAAGSRGLIVIAADDWANPGGGYESLTVPAMNADIQALNVIRCKVATIAGIVTRTGGCTCTCHATTGSGTCGTCCQAETPAHA